MTDEKVTLTCSWCRGEWKMSRERLNAADFGTIQHIFETPIQFIAGKGATQLTGQAVITVTTEQDICPHCALQLAKGGIADLETDGIEET